MSWQKLTLRSSSSAEEKISDFLHEIGAIAITLQDAEDEPIFEPAPGTTPLWQRIYITALFPASADLQLVLALLYAHAENEFDHPIIESLAEQDWQQAYQAAFQPMQFGQRLWVCPSWHTLPEPDSPHLILDPGMAFGTGTHATTALCLEWLAETFTPGQAIIDYGCGSGILAIAALKLGAKHAWCVDNDPQALEATQANAERNQLSTNDLTIALPQALPAMQTDLILANILANPLIELADRLSSLLKTGGTIVLSGILANQAEKVISAYAHNFTFTEPKEVEGWVRLVGIKN